MKRAAQPALSMEGRHALDYYAYALKQLEDLSAATIRNYLSDLRQFMAWCECHWREAWNEAPFTPQAVTPPFLIRCRTYLQTILCLKPSSVNRANMSLRQYLAWAASAQVVQQDPISSVKFVPKEAPAPRHLDDDEEGTLLAAVNATGTLRDRTIITLLRHSGMRTQELCTLTCKQAHPGKRKGTLRIVGKRKKVCDAPLNASARAILSAYLGTLLAESCNLVLSEKTQGELTERVLGHLITKYARREKLADVSPHDLRHRFGYRMAEVVPLHRLTQIMGHVERVMTMLSIRGTKPCSWG